MGFKYVVNCDTLTFLGHDFLENPAEILEQIKKAGYDGIDVPGNPERVDTAELPKMLEDIGLAAVEVSGAWAWGYYGPDGDRNLAGPDEQARARGVEYSKRLIDLAAELGAELYPACPTQPPVFDLPWPKTDPGILRDNFISSLSVLCEYAGERGITVAIEPLNRYEAYAGVATTVEETLSLIEELGVDNLGIQPDIAHMNREESSIYGALRKTRGHLAHMHINETNYTPLGSGHADFHAVLKILKDMDFSRYISIYMPVLSQEVMQGNRDGELLSRHLTRSLEHLKVMEEAVDLQGEMFNGSGSYSLIG